MKNTVFWDVVPCSVVGNESFEGSICLHCKGSKRCSSNSNQCEQLLERYIRVTKIY
jgi:hypothetical protein